VTVSSAGELQCIAVCCSVVYKEHQGL